MIGWFVVLLVRLIPFRPPNVEPIMATALPFARGYGSRVGAIFAALSIVVYDSFTAGFGWYTLVTALAYAFVVALSPFLLRGKVSPLHYAGAAIVLTILYDALTGLTIGPIMFHQSLADAFFGQIPFTLQHLMGNIVLALALSPIVERWIVNEERLEYGLKQGFSKA